MEPSRNKRKRDHEQGEEQNRGFQRTEKSLYVDTGSWVRGPLMGKGNFASVYLAFVTKPILCFTNFPPILAVKSSKHSSFTELLNEKSLLKRFQDCPFIIKYYGYDLTEDYDNSNETIFNLFMEFAIGGSLGDLIKRLNGVGLLEEHVKWFTESSLRGLKYIHEKGFVHCDIKPDNILLVANNENCCVAKIGDLGFTKRIDNKVSIIRGTISYLSPEAVIDGIQGPSSDIWALGCTVLEMLTGNINLNCCGRTNQDFVNFISKLPKIIPSFVSEEAKDFLIKCFLRNPDERFTADMLLGHPFINSGACERDGDYHDPQKHLSEKLIVDVDQEQLRDSSSSPDNWGSFIPLD